MIKMNQKCHEKLRNLVFLPFSFPENSFCPPQRGFSGQTRPMELLWSFALVVKLLQMDVIGNVEPELMVLFFLAQGSSKIGLGYTFFTWSTPKIDTCFLQKH